MKKFIKAFGATISILLAMTLVLPVAVFAAMDIPANTFVWTNGRINTSTTASTSAYNGYVKNEEYWLTGNQITKGNLLWLEVAYKTKNSSTKTSYALAKEILDDVNFSPYTVYINGKQVTYKGYGSSSAAYGYVQNENVIVIGPNKNGRIQILYNIANGKKIGYIAASAVTSTVTSNTFSPLWPTDGGRITAADTYPSSGKSHSCRYAHGIDIGVKSGTNVYSTESGVVDTVKNLGNSSFGRYIIIKHPNGAYSLYAHLSQQLVKEGDSVSRGQVIAKSGNTGNSTGAHLHFEISTSTQNRLADYFPNR